MTVIIPSELDYQRYLLLESLQFPGTVAIPQVQATPEGQLHSFQFGNGYGALVLRAAGQPLDRAFEICLMDHTLHAPQPCYDLPLCPGVQSGLSHGQVSALLSCAERLPEHPRLAQHNARLLDEVF
ncbi:hypothetical protein [Deinococcus sonorensis]|uniref:Aminoglycoside phosphotransferase domain-containing protein n=2 Tax=Deinococcus sonorensis TaxID=309891 RepID=A0AAU7UAV1_9DEIO